MSTASPPAATEAMAEHSALLADAGFRHGFFTRNGGVSEAPFATLNFAATVGDKPENVEENLRRAATHLGVPHGQLYFLSQVHGTDAQQLDGSEDAVQMRHIEGDITYSDSPAVGCAIRMADCAPVLIADRQSGAVAAAHSGWRGTVAGVAAQAVTRLRTLIGGPGELLVAVGPHIEACCFEVGADVAAEIAAAAPEAAGVIIERQPRPHVDLRKVLDAQIARLDVAAVDHVRGCTLCAPERYHSYRRDGVVSGRMLAAIATRV